jgi:transcriptional regulator with XRE-family HTH domain
MTTDEGIGERLRLARDAAGLTQAQAAKKMNMHRPTISEIEAGRRRVSTEEAKAFADLYGADLDWLITGASPDAGTDGKLLLAARQLSKLKDADLDRLMKLLRVMKKTK